MSCKNNLKLVQILSYHPLGYDISQKDCGFFCHVKIFIIKVYVIKRFDCKNKLMINITQDSKLNYAD